jgi:PE family
MSKSLNVIPEELSRVGDELGRRYADALQKAKTALQELGTTARIPAGADRVSRTAAQSFDEAGKKFHEPTAVSLQTLDRAGLALLRIAQGYNVADDQSRTTVQQAASGILGPLIQLASTLPQQIAQGASATGEAGDAAAFTTDEETGDEDAAPDTTIV